MNKSLLILPIIALVVIISTPFAFAEEIIITAENAENSILVAFDGDLSYILYETPQGISEHFDGKLKVYNSGGFSLKSLQTGISVWGHPVGDEYKLVVLTSEGVERFVGQTYVKKISVEREIVQEEIVETNGEKILREYWENRNITNATR